MKLRRLFPMHRTAAILSAGLLLSSVGSESDAQPAKAPTPSASTAPAPGTKAPPIPQPSSEEDKVKVDKNTEAIINGAL